MHHPFYIGANQRILMDCCLVHLPSPFAFPLHSANSLSHKWLDYLFCIIRQGEPSGELGWQSGGTGPSLIATPSALSIRILWFVKP
jgi:hypothetical protein